MQWRRIQVGTTEKIISIGSNVQSDFTSLYTIDTATPNSYRLTIKSVSSNDYGYAYKCEAFDSIYYIAQITSGSLNSRNTFTAPNVLIVHLFVLLFRMCNGK